MCLLRYDKVMGVSAFAMICPLPGAGLTLGAGLGRSALVLLRRQPSQKLAPNRRYPSTPMLVLCGARLRL